jgi:hypothetical protein
MHRDLEAARKCLAELVAGHQQAFARCRASGVEFLLFGIRLVVPEPVFS